jgi:hypothetical protein
MGLDEFSKEDNNFQILKIKWINKVLPQKIIINAVTWKSWLHVRPSTVLAIEINKLRNKYSTNFNVTFINNKTN